MDIQFFQHRVLKRLSFSHCTSVKNQLVLFLDSRFIDIYPLANFVLP